MTKLKFIYNNFFYTIYKWNLSVNKHEKIAVTQTILALVFFNVALINLIISFIDNMTNFDIPSLFSNIFYFNSRLDSLISFKVLRLSSNKKIEVNIGKLSSTTSSLLTFPSIKNSFVSYFNPIPVKTTASIPSFFFLQSKSVYSFYLKKIFDSIPINTSTRILYSSKNIESLLSTIFSQRE